MITIEQCRGARGILGWTQQDLADASGLSKTAINNFEKGHSDIKAESLRAIRMAFESSDIEFIATKGVAKRTESIEILRGPSALNDLIEDIHSALSQGRNEILIANVDQTLPTRIATQKLFRHIEILKDKNVTERVLCPIGTTSILSPSDECRWLEDGIAQNSITTFIYADKVAFELWDQSMITIISSAEAAAAERERFETLWAKAQIPATSKTAPQTQQSQHKK